MEIIRVTKEEMDYIPYVMQYWVMPKLEAITMEEDCIIDCSPMETVTEEVKHYVYHDGQEWNKLFLHGDAHTELMQLVSALEKSRNFWKKQSENDIKEFVHGLQDMFTIAMQINKKPKKAPRRSLEQVFMDLFKSQDEWEKEQNRIIEKKQERLHRAYKEFEEACLDM